MQTLVVEKDSRLTDVTDADLREQFALAMQVRDATSHCNEMVIRIRAMKKQIEDRLAKNTGAAQLASAAHAVEAKLSGIEEELYQVKNRSPRDTLNYPIKLNNQLATLMSMIEMGDSKPTSQMYAVFQDLSATLGRVTDRLNTAESTDLVHLNELLKSSQLEPITGR
jgi:seryl-tRNA synthetase